MSSEEEPDLPVTAVFVENTEETYYSDIYFSEEGFNRDNTHDLQYFRDSQVHNVVECTRRSDAEEAIKEARRQERQRILDKIEKKVKQVGRLGEQYGSEMNADMIKNELEELRDELEEEVDQS